MDTRRDFLRKASLLAGATAATQFMPDSIQRALAIDAPAGSTYLDAEHVVFLMQENRSFDHSYGTLKGVRGFNDPRTITNQGLPIWLQKNAQGKYYTPFHLDIEKTKSTWMGSLPHGWRDMVYARNNGKMNTWLEAKKAGNPNYKHMPLTLGYYNRQDLPFYYAFADAFTVCDQHFCSSLTGTSANRSYFWSGTVREEPRNPESTAHVDNGQINYRDVSWKTYPERLQEAGIDWRVYQNELSVPVGFEGEEEDWLANFTDNNLEFHKQYQVKFHPAYYEYIKKEIPKIEHQLMTSRFASEEAYKKVVNRLEGYKRDVERYSPANFAKLSKQEQEIHKRAFTTNTSDPDYHSLADITYSDSGTERTVKVPKGDLFYQFRKDVEENKLPTVSWLVAPCRFSDHPGSPWFGAWYVSETLDILTKNPEVWKKTIFILTYDENDGYFDHIPPFVPALHTRPETGAVPKGMETADEFVTNEQEKKRSGNNESTLDSPIGLGFRVPLVIASPWSKGGWVNSEVCDHTSTLQFLEHFIQKKTGKKVLESNISAWRRLVCGDLTSVFRKPEDSKRPTIDFVDRDAEVSRIYKAQAKGLPEDFDVLDSLEDAKAISFKKGNNGLQLAEPGTKQACAIPYDIDVNFAVDKANQIFTLIFQVAGQLPAHKVVGVPFFAKSAVPFGERSELDRVFNFAVKPNESIHYKWSFDKFVGDKIDIEVYGPNGFYRRFAFSKKNIPSAVTVIAADHMRGLQLKTSPSAIGLSIEHIAYGHASRQVTKGKTSGHTWNLARSSGWYHMEVTSKEDGQLLLIYAGHQENGKPSMTDPVMGAK